MKINERRQALAILTQFFQKPVQLSHLLPSVADLTPLAQEICYGVCRYFFQLESILNHLINKPPKDQQIWVILLIGVYQLHYLRIPDYAVVKETVDLLDKIKKPWAKGLVNAVLRNFCRNQEKILDHIKENSAFKYNHPEWFVQKIKQAWPSNWMNILKANDNHPPMFLRTNVLKNSREQYLNKLQAAGIQAKSHPLANSALELEKPAAVTSLPGFKEGEVSVQDAAAQLTVSLLDLKPGLKILDACGAPGGKTAHMLETQANIDLLTLDIEPKRLEKITENLTRLNLSAQIKLGDALNPESWWDGKPFDRILLDAPCSATGVIRRHPDIKLLRTKSEIQRVVRLQKQLLDTLWPLLNSGGLMVYATCSIMPEENEQQIAQFIDSHPDAYMLDSVYTWGHFTGHGWQILPGDANMDGFFYSVIHKK